ncbi:MAG: ATP-binding cassette domain-containing protein [Bacteroidetes bacterium]|nr:ATP-binding cassette domain-containing protein [Bacteroidota bacterium]
MPATASPVTRILDLVKLDRKEITAIYFYAVLNGLIQLSVPLGVQAIIGFVLGASMRASLVVLILLVVLGVFSAGIMQINQMKLIEKIQQKIFVRYSFAFAEHIPKLDMKKTDNVYLPELINRFFDIPVLQKSLSKILLDIPTASIQILFGLLLLSLYHPAFIFFGLILLLILWLILRFTGRHGLQTSLEESTFKYRVAAWLEEMARIIRPVKLARVHELHLRKTDEMVTGYLEGRNSHFKVLLFQSHVLVLFKTVITAAMLIVGTFLLVNQQLNIGQFIAAEIVILLVLNSVEKLIMTLSNVYDTLTAVEKLANLTEKPIENSGSLPFPDGKEGIGIVMKNLSFGYTNDKIILHDVQLQIKPGEKVLVTGSEGAGKSTLLRVMSGSYTDFTGSLLFDGVPAGNFDIASFRAQTGVLLSQQDIFQGSLWDNITLGNDAIRLEDVQKLCTCVGLEDYITSLPLGYDTLLDPTGKRLSKTTVHKILLVRSLVPKPRLLLLEDPLLLLDEKHRLLTLQLLLESSNTTVVMSADDHQFNDRFNKIIAVNDGKATVAKNR